ncbi:MAG: CBS domain-containing protein [Nitrosopumilaceae archaeon]|uniref:CBS domain-containing protein n=3 Tax=Candidatus Nitrosomaritimum aestuariumsis TaxID=3342354 RepID=A0AC60W3C9_9ARCH|nr:CBS domain-containing protein [Nitrosopumilaceae archaeon]MBA4454086.1 CBS domain-containing protein [Nitrosopumilaceae archaeon]MBA4459639.1 CBS domain-containing protein [Nitrosopumilaceae archaeon]MBA4461145.1 CBS domain-containing protein [Nitrosopumilaceae archaeon]MBA4463824.1 CBS domain-containing protein [Nitrosopumilaceae archaeon]
MAHTFVKDVMISNIATLDSSSMIKDAAKLMDEKNIGCVIVTENNQPVGILTERDFVKRIASKEKPLTSPLKDVMSSPLISIDPDETVWEAAEEMKVNNIHKLPVIKENKITGIITTSDLVQICSVGSDSEMRRICDEILTRMQKE